MRSRTKRRRGVRWLPIVLLVLAAAFASRHVGDVKGIIALLGHAHAGWMALALLFQAGTYLAVGFAYRTLAVSLKAPLAWGTSAKLAVVNLFVNAAVPSAGLSGNLFLVRMMTRKGVKAGTGSVIVLLERTAYFTALAIFAALVVVLRLSEGRLRPSEVLAAGALAGVVVGLILLARKVLSAPRSIAEKIGRWSERAPRWVRKRVDRPALLEEARHIEDAGGASALPWRRVMMVLAAEGSLLLLDSLTVWALFRAIGSRLPFVNASMGFGLATVLAQILVIPGTLEVGLAGILRAVGARTGSAVAVTLLFHALSFWLPLPLGWLFYRNAEVGVDDATDPRLSDPTGAAPPSRRIGSAPGPSS